MAEVYGRVQRIVSKPAGRGTAYNIQMDSGDWYGYGFQRPEFGEGAEISFDVMWKGQYGNVDVKTLQIISGGNQQQGGGRPPQQQQHSGGNNGNNRRATPNASGGAKDAYWTAKEERDKIVQKQIQYQAARNAAIEVVKVGVSAGVVSLPAAKGKGFDALLALVDEITETYNSAVTAVNPAAKQANPAPQQDGTDQFEDDIPF